MDADLIRKRLLQETTCSLCLDFFTDPVMLECGHTFCKGCIFDCWGEPPTSLCVQCQESVQCNILRPNKQLVNIADIVRQLNNEVMKESVAWGVCESHQKPLKFFCKDDEALICSVGEGSESHKEHHVVLAETTAEEYRGQIFICLENLWKKRKELLVSKENTEKESQDLLDMVEKERMKTVDSFALLHQFLEEKENCLLAQMEEVDQEIAKKREEDIARLSEELSSLENTILEMEEKCFRAPCDLLKDITDTLQRCEQKQKEKLKIPVAFPPELKWRIWDFWDINPVFETVIKKFKDTLKSESLHQKVRMTLDRKSAHPLLRVSEDGKRLTLSDQRQSLPKCTQRFIHYQGALGSMLFRSGRHCWEIEVGKEDGWAVGISLAPSQYDDVKDIGPDAGVWAIGKWEGKYRAVIPPNNPPLPLSEEPKKIRVSLNYLGHRVAFFDANTAAMLKTFSIPVHRVSIYYPFFGLWTKSCLRLVP